MKKKGAISIYLAFLITAIVIVVITAVAAPMGTLFTTEMYAAGETIFLDANESIADINDTTVQASVYNMLDKGFAAQENNIAINTNLFQYSWVFILVLAALVAFLFTRQLREIQGGFI